MGAMTTVPAEQVLFALSRVHTTALLTLVHRANFVKVYSYSDVSAVKMGWLPKEYRNVMDISCAYYQMFWP